MFRSIETSKELFDDYDSNKIDYLSKVNLFVGQNNSGKSRLLRRIFSLQELKFTPSNLDITELNRITNSFYQNLADYFKSRDIDSFGDVTSVISGYQELDFITSEFSPEKDIYKPFLRITNSGTGGSLSLSKGSYREEIGQKIAEGHKNTWPKLQEILPYEYKYTYDSIYIPPLRGLRPLIKNDKQDFYKNRTIEDHFLSQKEVVEEQIFTGLTLYEDLKELLLGKHSERKKVSDFEEFLSTTFFNNREVNLIPNIKDDVVYIKIGDSPDIPIYELGDGIQSIIILTYPLFFRRDIRLNVFIDEPEMYLHPGMQRILLGAFADEKLFPNHQFFMSTHSNHLLDMTSDFTKVSIYTVSHNSLSNKFEIKNVENATSNVLNILGVNNSSVFLSNCTIWVEGITDRLYLRKYLEVYFKAIGEDTLKEDLHFAFVEYGGGNITHWSFLEDPEPDYPNINVEFLCSQLFLISDKDGAGLKRDGTVDSRKLKKYERHEFLKSTLGQRYYCLESREIENSLSPEILRRTVLKFEKGNEDKLEFKEWIYTKYKDKPLGNFINANLQGKTRDYSTKSGTINEKVKFCKRACMSMKKLEHLTDEAIVLCKKLHSFISTKNGTSM